MQLRLITPAAIVCLTGFAGCGSSASAPNPAKLASQAIIKAEQAHIDDAEPGGMTGTKITATCPHPKASGLFHCTARLGLAVPGADQVIPLVSSSWHARLNTHGSIDVGRDDAVISRFAQADAKRDCVGKLIDAMSSGDTDIAALEATTLPCRLQGLRKQTVAARHHVTHAATPPARPSKTDCGHTITANPDTSCAFALNTFRAYASTYRDATKGTVTVRAAESNTSPVFTMRCVDDSGTVECVGGQYGSPLAEVEFPQRAAAGY